MPWSVRLRISNRRGARRSTRKRSKTNCCPLSILLVPYLLVLGAINYLVLPFRKLGNGKQEDPEE